MARPTYPTPGQTGWNTGLEAAINDVSDRADLALSTASGASATPGGVLLDSFSGANDDAKLTAAMSYAAAQTVKPAIYVGNRQYSFSQTNRSLYSGFKLIGLGGFGDQQRAANSIPNDIRFTGNGTWFVNPGTTYDVEFRGLCLQGNSNGQFIASNPGVLWTSKFSDLGFNLWKYGFGNPASKFLNTAILLSGWGNVNNSYNTFFSFGGSDSNFFVGGEWLIDSPTSIMTASAYHLRFDYQEKSHVGPIYMTAERSSGIYITGGSTTTGLVFNGMGRIEGRNIGAPCVGSNVRIDGGSCTFRDWWISYGATALNSNGHTGEGGVITQTGGNSFFDGCWYDRATGVAETVPWLYVSGGVSRVRNMRVGTKGGSWSGLPRVDEAGGTIDADSSVTKI